jgi:hypothetical protein
MKVVGIVLLLVGAAHVSPVYAQEAAKPDINLTLTETLNRLAPGPSTRDDIREIPPPRNDKLRDATRVTVIVGSPECLPGEDLGMVPRRRPIRRR